jgi:hypothetical protein
MRKFSIRISKGHLRINGFVQKIGQDILISIWGGTRPHIGAIGMAIPRPSLKNSKRWSATSSIFTFIGHKEDMIVKKMSEKLAARLRRNVVVTAGLHWEGTTSREIKTIQNLTQKLSDQILKRMEKAK